MVLVIAAAQLFFALVFDCYTLLVLLELPDVDVDVDHVDVRLEDFVAESDLGQVVVADFLEARLLLLVLGEDAEEGAAAAVGQDLVEVRVFDRAAVLGVVFEDLEQHLAERRDEGHVGVGAGQQRDEHHRFVDVA